jgi:pimeloyl-ACP methyl ester carboxylesterase
MRRKLYALMVGIDKYPPGVGSLNGCVNDVNHYHDYLVENFKGHFDLQIELLKNNDAVRKNIIHLFRHHLCKAGQHDMVLFQYCGHGSREISAPEFKEYFPGSKDETLVCYDSRTRGGFDLADKELAVLLWEVAKKNPHIAVILDCCHSGSMTREADDFSLEKVRQTKDEWDPDKPRPLETYLDGYYKKMKSFHIPKSKHVLMAACDRTQKAWETCNHRGLFSTTLLNVLAKSGPFISYADLFVRCRTAILKYAQNQTPQFETYARFMPYGKFLDGSVPGPMDSSAGHHVYFDKGSWEMNAGALHGLPGDPEKKIEVALYPNSSNEIAGYARAIKVGPQKSTLEFDFESSKNTQYKAEIISLPIPPMPVYLEGDEPVKTRVKESVPGSANFTFVDEPGTAKYVLSVRDGQFLLSRKDSGALIQGAEGDPKFCLPYIFSVLEKIIKWGRNLELQNHNTSFNQGNIELKFVETLEDGREWEYKDSDITLDFIKAGDEWKENRGKLQLRNLAPQQLHFTLVYFSEAFGIHILRNDPIEPGKDFVTFWGDGENDYFYLPEEKNDAVDTFKLIVSTEAVDDFLLVQDDLDMGKIVSLVEPRAIGTTKPMRKLTVTNDWFTKTLTIKTVRQLDRVSEKDALLANGQITIKGHASFRANIGLAGGKPYTRSIKPGQDTFISTVLTGKDFELLQFSAARGEGQGVLELTDISNEKSLKENPLEILLDTRLEQDEYVLPLTFDGTHILPVGRACIDENRKVSIRINHIPEGADEARRSLGKALKLCFLKLILRRKDLNQLCRVEYQPDGTVIRHKDQVKEKVANADRILLLIHGIIGDTESIAEGLKLAAAENGKSIVDHYDLILTYDYENLNTPIDQTAKRLKDQLKEVGLHERQEKKITILAHSMGGLVSRWLIEREKGNQFINHLVLAGTPNRGSAFADMAEYKNLAITVLTISLNFLKPLITFAGALLFTLNQSKTLTPTLEQMGRHSNFIRDLGLSGDPTVRYTILAGDITDYDVEQEGFFVRLMEKIELGIGKLVYRGKPNDIAVSVESIKHVDDFRQPAPEKIDLACHHLNYFQSGVSLKVLAEVLTPG